MDPLRHQRGRGGPGQFRGLSFGEIEFVEERGRRTCSRPPALFRLAGAVYDAFRASLGIQSFTPGDNDWTDCHGVVARKFSPSSALPRWTMFFPKDRPSASARYPSSAKSPTQKVFNDDGLGGLETAARRRPQIGRQSCRPDDALLPPKTGVTSRSASRRRYFTTLT